MRRRGLGIAVLLLALLTVAPQARAATPTKSEEPAPFEFVEAARPLTASEKRMTRAEWYAMHIGGGNYGFHVDHAIATLRWPNAFWEVVRGGISIAGPGFGKHGLGLVVHAGTACGYPLYLTDDKTQELRFKTGLFGGIMNQAEGPFFDFSDTPHKTWDAPGPFIMAEISYVLHTEEVSFETGLTFMAATWAHRGHYPHPLLLGFFGFRS